MNATVNWWLTTRNELRNWSWMKKSLFVIFLIMFIVSSFLFLTQQGLKIRKWMAETVITTQHRDWAWIFVGAHMRDDMVQAMQDATDVMGTGHIDTSRIKVKDQGKKRNRSLAELLSVQDISGPTWKGKKMTVFDPRTVRVVVPAKQGEGERITSMMKRTGAVAGVNGGAFYDPDGLGNGFAPIGLIISGGQVVFTEFEGSVRQHVIGFTKDGVLVVGLYSIDELMKMNVQEAVYWKPRIIADGKPLITSGDGGWGIGPRTAVGQKADGTLEFIVIDGRQPPYSLGATLKEVQDIFIADGVQNAGFLDGGASSEMVVDGELITKPSSRYGERRLPSALLIFDHPEDYKVDHIWDGLTSIDPGGAATHPEYQQEIKKNGGKSTPTQAPTPNRTKSPEPTATNHGAAETTKPSSTPHSTDPPKETVTPGNKPGGTAEPTSKPTSPDNTSGTSPPGASSTPKSSAKPGGDAGGQTGSPSQPGATTSGKSGESNPTPKPTTNSTQSTGTSN